MLASERGASSGCTAGGARYKPPACCQRLALFNNFSPKAVATQRSALRLGPGSANEKVGEILKVSMRKTIVLRGGYGADEI